MFSVAKVSSRFIAVLAGIGMLSCTFVASAAAADAPSLRVKASGVTVHSGISGRHGSYRRASSHSGRRHFGSYGRSPSSSGVRLSRGGGRYFGNHQSYAWSGYSGPKIIRYDTESGKWRDHRYGADQIAIVVGSIANPGQGGNPSDDGALIEGGKCAAGAYCTVRLGPYANSPKIITLNGSGKTITKDLVE